MIFPDPYPDPSKSSDPSGSGSSGWQPFSIFIFSDKKRSPFLGGVRGRVWSIMAGANNLVVPVGTYRTTKLVTLVQDHGGFGTALVPAIID
jgi:hypothetical protein